MEEYGFSVALHLIGAKRGNASFPRCGANEGQLLSARSPTERGNPRRDDAGRMNDVLERQLLLAGLTMVGGNGAGPLRAPIQEGAARPCAQRKQAENEGS